MEVRMARVVLNRKLLTVIKEDFRRKYNEVDNISDTQSVVKVMNDVFGLSEQAEEYVYIICMTSKCKPICFFEVAHGSQTKVLVEPSAILTRVLLCGAPEFILIHNHPSGNPKPSVDDIRITNRIRSASELVGVTMADHIIIGRDGFFNFKVCKPM